MLFLLKLRVHISYTLHIIKSSIAFCIGMHPPITPYDLYTIHHFKKANAVVLFYARTASGDWLEAIPCALLSVWVSPGTRPKLSVTHTVLRISHISELDHLGTTYDDYSISSLNSI